MANILITGGFGFVGQHLVHELVERNKQEDLDHKITILDLRENKKLFPDDFESGYVETILDIDVTDYDSLHPHFETMDIVYHLVAIMKYGRRNYEILDKINVQGSANVLTSCEKYNVNTLVHVSSIGAIGYHNKDIPLTTEDFPTNWEKEKKNQYGYSKKRGEDAVMSSQKEGLRVSAGMPAIMLGAGDLKSLPLYKMGRKMRLMLAPRGGTPFADVRDVARGLVAIEERGENKERYLLTSNNIYIKQLFKEIARHNKKRNWVLEIPSFVGTLINPLVYLLEFVMPRSSQLSMEGTGKAFDKRFFSNKKAKEKLGWEPIYKIQDTIDYAVTWGIREGYLK